ncbi:MAG: leucine-rich repeat protein [Ruminococcus sp.]|nr:leucine-rich repeat protein [Ruminococcus sp.]
MKNRVSRFVAAVLAASMTTGGTSMLPGTGLVSGPQLLTASADDHVSGDITYAETEKGVTITGYTGTASNLTIPEAIGGKPVISIGKKAFFSKTELVSVKLPHTMKEIGDEAFRGCTCLEKIELNEGLETIGNYAFYLCGFTAVNIPSTLVSCSSGFNGCSSLEMAVFASGITAIPEGCLQNIHALKEVVMPDSVKTIGKDAFKNCDSLRKANMPSKLREIGSGAFYGSGLTEITLPASLEKCEGSFADSKVLRKVTFAKGTVTVPYRCMSGVKALKQVNIPASVKTISAEAFKGCTDLAAINLPDGLEIIRSNAFYGTNIMEVVVPTTLTICDSAFKGCASLKTAVFKDGMDAIPYNCFSGSANLEKVIIPDTVRTIGGSAFAGTTMLKSIVIPESVETVGGEAFEGSGLKSIELPNSVTKLGASAFSDCKKLKTAVIGSGIKTLENGVFSGDTALESVTVPGAVKTFSAGAFSGCENLSVISYPGKAGSFKAASDAFKGCYSLKDPRFVSLNASGTEVTAEKTRVAVGNRVGFIVSFGAIAGSKGENILSLNIPDGLTVDPTSLEVLSGVVVGKPELGVEDLISFVSDSGTVRFEAVAREAGEYTLSVDLRNSLDTSFEAPVGKTDLSVKAIGISVPDTSGTLSPVIRGTAPEGESIDIYMNGSYIASTVANVNTGIYTLTPKLPANTADGKSFTFYAKAGDAVSDEVVMVYSAKQPSVSSVKICTDETEGDTDITKAFTEGKIPVVYAPSYTKPRYTLSIANSNLVDSVYVTANVNGSLKSIKAQYNSTAGVWTASGSFGGVPCDVNIVIVTKANAGKEADLTDGFFTTPGHIVFLSSPSGTVYDAKTSKPVEGAELSLVGRDEDGMEYSCDLSRYGQKENTYTNSKGEYIWDIPEGDWKITCTADGYVTSESGWLSVPDDDTSFRFALEKAAAPAVVTEPATNTEPTAPAVSEQEAPVAVPAEVKPVTIVPEGSENAPAVKQPATFYDGVDNWSFGNSSSAFKTPERSDYFMTDADYEKLISGLSNSEIERINTKKLSKWTGSCYGMAALSLLSCYGMLDMSAIDPNASSPYTAAVPPTDEVISAINYYHLAQLTDYISACRNQAIYDTPEEVKTQFIIEEVSGGYPVLIPFHSTYTDGNGNVKRAAHVVVGYGIEDCEYNNNGNIYDKKIITYDPNCIEFKENACMYINTSDGSWIVPRYLYKGADSKLDAQLGCCTSELGIVNYHSLFDKTGGQSSVEFIPFANIASINCDYTFEKVELNDDGTYSVCDGMEDDVKVYADISGLDEEEDGQALNFILDDTDKAYLLRLSEKEDIDLTLRTGNDMIRLCFDNADEVLIDPTGMIRASGDKSGFNVTMVSNEGHSPTAWDNVEVSGESAQVEFRRMGNGYVLIGDDLRDVNVSAEGADSQTSCQFTTDCDKVLIHEVSGEQLGVSADTDGNGTYELQLVDIPGLTGIVGDTNGDNITDANDASEILSLYAKLSTGNGDVSEKAKKAGDVNKDGLLDSADASLILEFYAAASTSSDITAEKFFKDRIA